MTTISINSEQPLLNIFGRHLLTTLLFLRKAFVGTIAVGFFLGAIYFLYFLVRLARLDPEERQYKQQRHHFQAQTLLRYIIVIFCMLTLSILFYTLFDFGKESMHVGIIMWVLYGLWHLASPYIRKNAAKKAM